jgi:hypothetical protein
MAVVLSNRTFSEGALTSANTYSFSLTRAVGESLVLMVTAKANGGTASDITSVVWDAAGDNQTFAPKDSATPYANYRYNTFELPAPTSVKTGTVTITFDNTALNISTVKASAAHFTGANTTTLISTFVKSVNQVFTNTVPLSQSISSAIGEMVVGVMSVNDVPGSISAASGQSNVAIQGTIAPTTASSTKPGATTVTMGWNTTSGTTYENAWFLMSIASDGAADTTVPTMTGTLTSSGVTSSGFTMSWAGTTRGDNVAITGYETSVDGTTYTDRGNVTSYAFTGLAASTSYTRYVRAYDAAGNKSTPALSITVVTSAPSGDTTVPVLAGSITQGAITSTTSTITWPAGSDNVAVTAYEVSKDNGTTYTSIGNVLTYTFTGLTPSTSYTQRVRAKDAAGNVSTPALSLAVTTSAVTVGSFTSRPMVNDTNTVLASQAGWTVRINNATTGDRIATKTGLTTSSTGVLTYSDAGCTAGTSYENIYIASNGDKGLQDLVAT